MQTVSPASLATIGARSARWPDHQAIQWQAMRQVVTEARAIVAEAGDAIDQAKADHDLTVEAKARRISRAALDGIAKLDSLPSLARAEKLVAEFLEGQKTRMPTKITPPSTLHDVQVASEIRAWISRQKSTMAAAMQHATDPVVMGAVLTAPGFLSGLSPEAMNAVRGAAENAINPEAVSIRKANEDAIAECRAAIVQAKSKIGQAGNLRASVGGEYKPQTVAA